MEIFPKIYGAPPPDAIDTREAEDFRTMGTSFFVAELLQILRKAIPAWLIRPTAERHRRAIGDLGRAGAGWITNLGSHGAVAG
jgi:hypothetical protein